MWNKPQCKLEGELKYRNYKISFSSTCHEWVAWDCAECEICSYRDIVKVMLHIDRIEKKKFSPFEVYHRALSGKYQKVMVIMLNPEGCWIENHGIKEKVALDEIYSITSENSDLIRKIENLQMEGDAMSRQARETEEKLIKYGKESMSIFDTFSPLPGPPPLEPGKEFPCPVCRGSGPAFPDCKTCNGSGVVDKDGNRISIPEERNGGMGCSAGASR